MRTAHVGNSPGPLLLWIVDSGDAHTCRAKRQRMKKPRPSCSKNDGLHTFSMPALEKPCR